MWRKFLKIAYNLEANANKTRGGSLGKPVNLANLANVVKMEILSKSVTTWKLQCNANEKAMRGPWEPRRFLSNAVAFEINILQINIHVISTLYTIQNSLHN